MSVDWEAIRAEYPALTSRTFLNTATFGQLSRRTVQAVEGHFRRRDAHACTDFLAWYDDMDRIREAAARLIHAQPTDIAFVHNASAGLATLLQGIEWKPGDSVVTLKDEFPNNTYATSRLHRKGVEFREVEWDRFYESIDETTRLVVLSALNYSSGFRPPLAHIGEFLKQRGVLFFVDATQGLGALRFDLQTTHIDVLAAHGYKWLLSPVGAGILYVRPQVRRWLEPTVVGWRSHHDWRSVDHLHHGEPEFAEAAERYEGGMIPFDVLYGMEQAISAMLQLGTDTVERRVLGLASRCREILGGLGGELVPGESPILAARFRDRDASMLARELKSAGVIASARHGRLRVSVHLYNNEADLEVLERELRRILKTS